MRRRIKMKSICPNCEKVAELELITKTEEFDVRGLKIPVEVKFFKCSDCNTEFEDPKMENDPYDKAYREYRRRLGMLQPEDIKDFRKKYGLTQTELSQILGWGGATLSRYENGALQDEAHEKILRLVLEPANILKLILDSPDALPTEKRGNLINDLRQIEKQGYSWERYIEERIGDYEPNEYNGYKKLDLRKLSNIVLYFCKEGIMKTKLNKMLFYVDFKHFKNNSISITGLQYARIPYGPVPDKYYHFFAAFFENNLLDVEEIIFSNDIAGEKFTSLKDPDLSLFGESELIALATVKDYFKGYNVKRISDFSHDEIGYKETGSSRLISYKYASYLQI
jgi:putative zinc finger/helix-turn-helix YgiT family protein